MTTVSKGLILKDHNLCFMFWTMIFKSMLQLFEYDPHLPGLKGHSFTVFTREARLNSS